MTTEPTNALAKLTHNLTTDASQQKFILMKDFLEHTAPGKFETISYRSSAYGQDTRRVVALPPIELHCDTCEKLTNYEHHSNQCDFIGKRSDKFITYTCRNCKKASVTYAIQFIVENESLTHIQKYGQNPAFGPRTPKKFLAALGKEADLFLKGRRAENQALGIAAYAYYRRVLDAKKDLLFDKVIAAANELGAEPALIQELTTAKKATRFTEATRTLRSAMPRSLLINGENPLTLLHDALSDGLHNQTDVQCLEAAGNVRVVLIHFIEQLDLALQKDQAVSIAAAAIKRQKNKLEKPEEQ
ncbi:hypothetical protein [Herminiimonas fonticola]|uniref:Uncharacterized protein n=1 Tax=Herminiimonas fonticola TaxID=303380 RepID=A0A4R6GFQ7_9BURK|nr:hypothetical protein [Herminiimonas fonticola]RBA24480.1 hypothetical protein Hfont_0113 [Herminiimonas fonticola]TDN93597.1 hypothetical protein EV677_0126 [Herminiimonas fonticola]